MFTIKNVKTRQYIKHTSETDNNGLYVEYPWELVSDINNAQQYTTLEHANEIAFWHLDIHDEWVLVDVGTREEYKKKTGKYIPV